jgi:hypothetical protein
MATWEAEQQQRAKRQADAEAVAKSAALVAFDRANHMGISEKTAEAIKVGTTHASLIKAASTITLPVITLCMLC